VRTDVPIQLTLKDLHYQGWQSEKLRELFVELNFTKLIEGLDANNREQI